MFILISADGSLSLQKHDDFKRFSIVDQTEGANRAALDQIAISAEDEHFWIDADAVIEMSPQAHNAEWVESFRSMLSAVEPYGYFDKSANRVKAHIDSAGKISANS